MISKGTLSYYWDIVLTLTHKEIKIRYKNNVLGYFWSILNPLALGMVFYIAFQVVMRIKMENYLLFLLAGLFPWQWFANSVGSAPFMFLGNGALIKKVNFPRALIPFTVILQDLFHFILSLPVFAAFMIGHGVYPGLAWVWGVPLLLIVTMGIVTGVVLLIASINLFFRDLANLVAIFLNMLFYFTPILYPMKMIPEKFKPLIVVNPVAPLFICWRQVLYENTIDWYYFGVSCLYAVLLFAIGYFVYRKLSWKFAEVI